MAFDVLELVGATYRDCRDTAEWLDGLLAAVAPLDSGLGVIANHGSQASPLKVVRASRTSPAAIARVWGELVEQGADSRVLMRHGVLTMSSIAPPALGEKWSTLDRELYNHGVPDLMGIVGVDECGEGTAISIGIERGFMPSPRTYHELGIACAHLAAATRWRSGGVADRDVAVLDDTGRLLDAQGAAARRDLRDYLRHLVQARERTRSRMRRLARDEALAVFEGMLTGEWSLLERVDLDGRRALVARRNRRPPDARALTARERQVVEAIATTPANKEIAFLFDISAATVAAHIRSAMLKLGLRSRRELIHFGRYLTHLGEPRGASY